MFKQNQQVSEFKSIGKNGEFYDLDEMSGWKINGVKVGYWIENNAGVLEQGEYIDGMREGIWLNQCAGKVIKKLFKKNVVV